MLSLLTQTDTNPSAHAGLIARIGLSLVLLLSLSGCGAKHSPEPNSPPPDKMTGKVSATGVAQPPWVPDTLLSLPMTSTPPGPPNPNQPPSAVATEAGDAALEPQSNPARPLSLSNTAYFKEIEALPDNSAWAGRIKGALSNAQKHYGLLYPKQAGDSLPLAQPLCRAQWAQWLQATWQKAPLKAPLLPRYFDDVPPGDPQASFVAWSVRVYPPKGLLSLRPANSKQQAGVLFEPEQPISRQELCLLYARLIHQESLIASTTEADWQEWTPPQADPLQTLDEAADYNQIAPWAKPAVALAYRNGVLQQVFNASPQSLSQRGFLPTRPVTTAEALLFLETVFEAGPT